LVSSDAFRPRTREAIPPWASPALTSVEYTGAFNEVKSLGIANSTAATADQALIGRFWNGAIQNYWNEITQTAVQAHHLTTAQSARTFALLNLTLADEVIAFYDTKYTYNFWRPVTAIRAAAADSNPDTTADPNWLPQAGKTAADPAYPGAHASISAGGAFVLKALFGDKPYQLNVTSEVLPGVVRSFDSFAAVEKEASLSRIYAGQHFRSDENAGEARQRSGRLYRRQLLDPGSQTKRWGQGRRRLLSARGHTRLNRATNDWINVKSPPGRAARALCVDHFGAVAPRCNARGPMVQTADLWE
jgi:hypothetical protein